MSREQEYAVIGQKLSERSDAERTFNLLTDEADIVSMKLMSLATDIRHNPERITMERLKGLELERLFSLGTSFVQAKKVFKEADEKAAKWLPSGTPRPVFDSASE